MTNKHKRFLKHLMIFLIIVGSIYGCAIYFALQEVKQEKEYRQRKKELREKNNQSLPTPQQDKDNIKDCRKTIERHIGVYDDDYNDPYDDPDFDDLIPGEEYDEEFIDRSQGDPELYE